MEAKKYHTDGIIFEKSQKEAKSVAHKYMTSDPPDLIQKSCGDELVLWVQNSFLTEMMR